MIPNHYQFAWPIQAGIAAAWPFCSFRQIGKRFSVLFAGRRILVSPLFGFVLLWFVTAPDIRYFGPLAWLFAIGPALVWISRRFTHAFIACGTTLCLCAVPIACFSWENRWIWITRERVLPQIPVVELEVSTNRHGLAIWYAKEGNKSFDAPLPSSWGFTPDLGLLDPSQGLAGGFKHVEPSFASDAKEDKRPERKAHRAACPAWNTMKFRITFQWIDPCRDERLRVAQQKLLESIEVLGLEPSLFPAGPEMIKFGDILRHARRESVGTSFVWCHSDVLLTKNPFLLAERGKVVGFHRKEVTIRRNLRRSRHVSDPEPHLG